MTCQESSIPESRRDVRWFPAARGLYGRSPHVRIDRRPLSSRFGMVLVAEIGVLATLVIAFDGAPPFKYELGWAALASFLAMQAYSLRRRLGWLRKLGSIEIWLDAHIFLGLQGAVFAAYHGIGLSPAFDLATAMTAIVVVLALTGVLGRYSPVRTQAIWALIHRPLAILLVALVALHILAHYAYAV